MERDEGNVSNDATARQKLDYRDRSEVKNTPDPTLRQTSANVALLVLGVPFGVLLGAGTALSLSWARPPLWMTCLALVVLFAASLAAAHFAGKRPENGWTSILQGTLSGFIFVLLLMSMYAVDALLHHGPGPF